MTRYANVQKCDVNLLRWQIEVSEGQFDAGLFGNLEAVSAFPVGRVDPWITRGCDLTTTRH